MMIIMTVGGSDCFTSLFTVAAFCKPGPSKKMFNIARNYTGGATGETHMNVDLSICLTGGRIQGQLKYDVLYERRLI